jgi:hypothetical protein
MSRKEVARSGKEVAVHHNGQTATSFPLRATSFLFILMDRQPPLFRVNEARSGGGCEKKGGCLSIKMNSHLFHFVPSTVMGAANSPKEVAVATSIDSSHLFPSTSCLRTPWADLVSMADSPWCVLTSFHLFLCDWLFTSCLFLAKRKDALWRFARVGSFHPGECLHCVLLRACFCL